MMQQILQKCELPELTKSSFLKYQIFKCFLHMSYEALTEWKRLVTLKIIILIICET